MRRTSSERKGSVKRTTKETCVEVSLALDGEGKCDSDTGIGFLDHMLDLLARHGFFDLTVKAKGDRHVDDHHTVEDVGICLGQALAEAVGDRAGLARFGDAAVPMEDALAQVAVDLGGRAACRFSVNFPAEKTGQFDTALVQEFFRALAAHAGMNVHIIVPYGENAHHIVEAIFKAFARALDQATTLDPRRKGIPSTKGLL